MSRERSATALVALGGGVRTTPPVRRVSPPSCRCRPGEAPRWVSLDLSPTDAAALRDVVAAAGVPVDAWLAVTLEFAIALSTLSAAVGSVEAARERLAQRIERCAVEMARAAQWRAWQSSLSRRGEIARDELPEVVLPERLLARAGGAIDPSVAFDHASDWPLARACELAACGRGQTLEAFVLELGLVGVPRGRC